MKFVHAKPSAHRNWSLPLLGVVALAGGLWCVAFSFGRITELRQLERVPLTTAESLVPGETKLAGRASMLQSVVTPYTKTRCIYFRSMLEEERTNSDGDTEWATIERDEQRAPLFDLVDGTGRVGVRTDGVDPDVVRHHRETRGKLRYTEYRLDDGDEVFVFAMCAPGPDASLELRFDVDGAYRPILSRTGERGQRNGRGAASVMLCWAGLSLAGVGTAFVLAWLGRHRMLTLVGSAGGVMAVALLTLGVVSMVSDLRAGAERVQRHEHAAREVVTRLLGEGRPGGAAATGDAWQGWVALAAPGGRAALDEDRRRRIDRIRLDLAASVARTNAIRDRFPERLFASAWGVGHFDEPILAPDESVDPATLRAEPARLGTLFGVIGFVAFGVGVLCTVVGLGSLRRKRWVENLHTTPPDGVVMGMAETTGRVHFDATEAVTTLKATGPNASASEGQGGAPLVSHYTKRPCVAFRYTEHERRGSGKNEHWVLRGEVARCVTFRVGREDEPGRGSIRVDPRDAQIMSERHTSKRIGRILHAESWLEPGDACYVLGRAGLRERDATHVELEIGAGRDDEPLLIAGISEHDVKLKLARLAFAWLTLGLGASIGAGLLGLGMLGGFSMDYYLLAAGVPVAYLLVVGIYILYLNLVFIREQVNRAWANIDVALAKRADLVSNVERVTKEAYAHERGVQEHLARLRALVREPGDAFGCAVTLLGESYPSLGSDALTRGMMDALVRLEDEISYVREGYNEAVREHNQRIATLPELILARAFGFGPRDFWGTAPGG